MSVLVTIQYPEGKTKEQTNAVLVKTAEMLSEVLNEKPEHIRVSVREVPQDRFCFGGTMFEDLEEY